ncbi:MAG: DUF4276 family protein [Muribaculaceae bacterium]|nr:DUF4276 family protein [Muribaculaceae bacterium]
MKYSILHILCEGQTEEKFVKDVLSPYLQQFSIYPKPILLLTSKKKNAKGGMLNYAQAKRDLIILRRQYQDNDSERHLFTTMFDFYALPDDFPCFKESSNYSDIRERISVIETAFAKDIDFEVFIPYIQLHDYNKVKSGTTVTSLIGIEALLDNCRHFKEWIDKIKRLAIITS